MTALFHALEPRILLSGDDHPDIIDFPDATDLSTDILFGGYGGDDGEGAYTTLTLGAYGKIEAEGDTDVFTFTTPSDSYAGIVIGLQQILSQFAPAITLMDSTGVVIAHDDGASGIAWIVGSGPNDEPAPVSLTPDTTYFVMMEGGDPDDEWETKPIGPYSLYVMLDITGEEFVGGGGGGGDDEGNGGGNGGNGGGDNNGGGGDNYGGGGGDEEGAYSIVKDPGIPIVIDDDHADIVQYREAASITLDDAGAGAESDAIETNNDTDAFLFTPTASGPVHIEIVTPGGVLLDAQATVYSDAMIPLWENSAGHAGADAELSFNAVAGETYVLGVSALSNTGAYEVRISANPEQYVLYHPEGYASKRIDEFIPLVNPNDAPVDYTIIARYEWGERDQIIASGTLPAHARGGVTVTSSFHPENALVRKGVPYALEIHASAPIGATLSHYDYGVTTGESFTTRVADEWTFARAHKGAGYQDYLVFSNPNDKTITVKATLYYEDGTTAVLNRTVEPLRRGGFAFASDPGVPKAGAFGVKLEASAPIVAALTSFDTAQSRGFGLLGDATGGST